MKRHPLATPLKICLPLLLLLLAAAATAATHPPLQVVSLGDGVNVRSGPDTETPIIGQVWHGVRMNVLEMKKGWLFVEFFSGKTGWIMGEFVETVAAGEAGAFPSPAEPSPPPMPTAAPYRIEIGDSIAVKSYRNGEIDEMATVRPDGCISLLLVDDIKVVGMTPTELDQLLTKKYQQFFAFPDITVIVKEIKQVVDRRVYVGGAVTIPKEIPLQTPTTVMGAIITSGGFLDTAKKKNIILIRKGEGREPLIYSLDLSKMEGVEPLDDNIYLEPFDIVIVPTTTVAKANKFVEKYIKDMLPLTLTSGFTWAAFVP